MKIQGEARTQQHYSLINTYSNNQFDGALNHIHLRSM